MSHAFAGVAPRPGSRPRASARRASGRTPRPAAPAARPARVLRQGDAYPATLGPPMPLPEAVAVGLSCAVSGAKTALASPSDAWKPLTGAVAAGAGAGRRDLSPSRKCSTRPADALARLFNG